MPLPYLLDEADQRQGALELELGVLLDTAGLRAKALPPHRISVSSTTHLYWTVAQMVAHHTSNGCNLRPGDLLGTGTISGPDAGAKGSLLEITDGGRRPLNLPSGEQRTFLADGDEVILTAHAHREGFASIGFGACRAAILPSGSASG
jgi:fumarylacetoacetase